MSLQEKLESLKEVTLSKIKESRSINELNQIRVDVLGKKGPITEVLRGMKELSAEERPKVGSYANEIRDAVTQAIEEAKTSLEAAALEKALAEESIDVTLPGKQMPQGTRHVLTQIMEEIEDIFVGMGYQVVEGFEVEKDHYNFERMNLPKDHPARDMQDTFYISDEVLIRTHTSPVQARTMEKHDFSKGPLRMISPGKVFRRDTDDATHSHQFHQIEGLVIDKNISFADLKGTLEVFAKELFGPDTKTKFRPHHFPFTEPSAEVDVSCFKCGGKGCRFCKGSGWIEILGCGMVHPHVLEMCGIDPEEYTGFAFGVGLERIALLKYEIDDMRLLYENDIRFLKQF